MAVETVAAALEREHKEIDDGIAAFASEAGAAGTQALARAVHALRRHIYLEEEFLFPLLCEGEPGLAAPVMVMLREHGQIWAALDALERETDGGRTLCRSLTVLLLHHNLKEEKILYPQADELLPAPTAARLREFIASRQLPDGWTCAKAAPPVSLHGRAERLDALDANSAPSPQ